MQGKSKEIENNRKKMRQKIFTAKKSASKICAEKLLFEW